LGKIKNHIESRNILREYVKRFGKLPKSKVRQTAQERSMQFYNDCFPQQKALIDDESKLKAALCSRRAGKSHTAAVYLCKLALEMDRAECAYVSLTRKNAKQVLWPKLKYLNADYDLNMHFNNTELIATFQNGSMISLFGANDAADVDKLRGPAFHLAILDECASFGSHIDELVEEVLEPTLIDHNGTLLMMGTPSAACTGIFFRATTEEDSDYSSHKWTIRDNPYIPHAEEWLSQRMQRRGWDEFHPVYLREWCGRWVRSADSLVYRFDESKNLYTTLPTDEYDFEYLLGVDLGFDDATAFVVGAFSRNLPVFYLVEEIKRAGMIPAEIAKQIQQLFDRYEFTKIVVDTGGLGKSIAEEFRVRYRLPVHPATKQDKFSYVSLLNSDMASGFIKVLPNSAIIDEWRLLQWDERNKREDDRFENHLSDAFLYAWRESKHYCSEELVIPPVYGTTAWFDAEAQRMEDADVEALRIAESQDWWEELN